MNVSLPKQTKEFVRQKVAIGDYETATSGQSTPAGEPYNQEHDEWVLLVSGSAGLWIEGDGERDLRPGDYVLIPAHRSHRVTWTAKDEPTVWLAVHLP